MVDYQRLKAAQRWMWSLGDYLEVAPRLEACAHILAEACDIRSGVRVLDVAAGTGNFAVAAARRGAVVTAVDFTPSMIEAGRARTRAEGAAVEWLEADAEDLPFADTAFDVVASVFGAMFAPRPARVAAELFRVARPGGTVGMANYSSSGYLGRLGELMSAYAPAAPAGLPSHFAWGDPVEVEPRFDGLAGSLRTERRTLTFKFDSEAERGEFWSRTNGADMALREMLPPERHQEMRAAASRLTDELNGAAAGRVILDSGYTVVVAVKNQG
jgi:ubiquinone/menaquinone biosynthesis C-methylase UbiE